MQVEQNTSDQFVLCFQTEQLRDLDFGLDKQDNLSINVGRISGVQVVLKQDEMINPFFVSISETQLDKLDEKELYTVFKRVLVLCMKQTYNGEIEAENIFNPTLNVNDFKNLRNYFTLLPCSRKILNNNAQYEKAVRVKQDILNNFNDKLLFIETEEIIIPMFELKEDMAQVHIRLYESKTCITNISDALCLNNYFNGDYPQRTHKQLVQMFNSMKESEYWTIRYNCENITMTQQFLERSFQFKSIMNDKKKKEIVMKSNKEFANVIDRIAHSEVDKSYQLNNIYKPDKFVDMSTVLVNQPKRTYFAIIDNNKLLITKEQVTRLFNSLKSERDMFDLFNTLLISKEYCHLVLNNTVILTLMEPLFAKFMPLYKYLFGYAWTCFYIEECIFKTKTTKDSRYVFDIRTANKLPVFPYSQDDIYQNPYFTFLVSDKVSDVSNNCMSTGLHSDFSGSKIDTLENFKWKFNLFTTGNPNKNIFDGLDWSTKYAVSGSMIPAFISVKPPLFDMVANDKDSESNQWLTYFNHFYSESDTDFMCNDESVFDFIDSIGNVIGIVSKNLNQGVNQMDEVKVIVEPIKSTTIVITEQYLKEKIDNIREYVKNQNLSMDELVVNIDTNLIKEYFYGIYTDLKIKNNHIQHNSLINRNIKDEIKKMYDDYLKIVSIDEIKIVIVDYKISKDTHVEQDSEIYIYMNDIKLDNEKVSSDKNIIILKVAENIKFKIRSNKLLHCIEAFRAKSKDFFAVVGRFHLPCVRGYYNGETVYLEPSCISANMTYINIDYKYFAGVRDPIEILNKYRSRGFGIILNKDEKQHMLYYNQNIPNIANMFNINGKSKDSFKNIFGFKDINSNIYKIGHFDKGFPMDVYNKIDMKSIKTIDDLQHIYTSNYNYNASISGLNMFKFKTINSNGSINPLQKWVIEACWNLLNK